MPSTMRNGAISFHKLTRRDNTDFDRYPRGLQSALRTITCQAHHHLCKRSAHMQRSNSKLPSDFTIRNNLPGRLSSA